MSTARIASESTRVIGSGLVAKAFIALGNQLPEQAVIYAAGVSSSSCSDPAEFERERVRLSEALSQFLSASPFVYFGTCSVNDPERSMSPYVQHKLAMETLVKTHPSYLICRLPQLAGRTPNPHTLLNYLYARIARSEPFDVWQKAQRNVIDVEDVAAITAQLILDPQQRNRRLNVANVNSYSILEIVQAMQEVVGKPALYSTVDAGAAYDINTDLILPFISMAGVKFDSSYLKNVLNKYYGTNKKNLM